MTRRLIQTAMQELDAAVDQLDAVNITRPASEPLQGDQGAAH
jgi:hypothetical protein